MKAEAMMGSQNSEANLREAQEIARLGRWELDLATGQFALSDGFLALFEADRGAFSASYDALLDTVHPGDRARVERLYAESIVNKEPYETEFRLTMKDGRTKWVGAIGRVKCDDAGNPARAVGTVQDITDLKRSEEALKLANDDLERRVAARTDELERANEDLRAEIAERRRAEEALRESEERLKLVIRGSNDAPWDWDLIKDIISYSPQWWGQLGYAPDEIPAGPSLWERMMHPDDKAPVNEIFGGALKNGRESYEAEFRLLHKGGHYVPVFSRGFISFDEDMRPVRVSGTNTDMTGRKRAEEAAREAERRYRAIVEDIPLLVCRFGRGGVITFVNGSYCRYFGKRGEELVGKSFLDLVPAQDRQGARKGFESITAENPVNSYEHRVVAADGSVRWQRWTDRAIPGGSGGILEYQSAGEDVTDRRLAEAEIMRLNESLESRILERTAQLNGTVRRLEGEVAERERVEKLLHQSL